MLTVGHILCPSEIEYYFKKALKGGQNKCIRKQALRLEKFKASDIGGSR